MRKATIYLRQQDLRNRNGVRRYFTPQRSPQPPFLRGALRKSWSNSRYFTPQRSPQPPAELGGFA
jgi:hypothetical protein